jgi:hypothetical protein
LLPRKPAIRQRRIKRRMPIHASPVHGAVL